MQFQLLTISKHLYVIHDESRDNISKMWHLFPVHVQKSNYSNKSKKSNKSYYYKDSYKSNQPSDISRLILLEYFGQFDKSGYLSKSN